MVQKNNEKIIVEISSILRNLSLEKLSSVPNNCGAYVIKVISGKRYVGSSKTVLTRIQAHQVYNDPNITEPIDSVCVYLTKRHMDARILENWLIREIKPKLNKSTGSCMVSIGSRSKCVQDCQNWDVPQSVLIEVKIQNIMNDIPAKNISSLPFDVPGTYIITTNTGKRYVGSSNSLRSRTRSHMDYKEGKNVQEPIKSISCYLTANEIDARILEYWLIREIKPELNREIQPDASTWKKGSKEILLQDAEDTLREILEKFSQRIISLPNVNEVVRKGWITYQLSQMKNFCAVKVKSRSLQVDLKVGEAKFKDFVQLSREIVPTQTWTFNRRLELHYINEIDKAFELVKQAYEFMKQ